MLGLDAVADGPYQISEFLSYDNRPLLAAAQDMDVHAVRVWQSQERQGAVEAALDEPVGSGGSQDVVAYMRVGGRWPAAFAPGRQGLLVGSAVGGHRRGVRCHAGRPGGRRRSW